MSMAFEDRLFDAGTCDWIDRREGLRGASPAGGWDDQVMHAWCHGAPGVALARVAVAEDVRGAGIEVDLERAANAVARSVERAPHVDFACCGDAGRVAAKQALHGSQVLPSDSPVRAMRRLHERAERAELRYRVPSAVGMASPSLLTGTGGIISTLLSEPEGPPSPLIALSLPERFEH
jgi:lantibiotic modifying enzyme